MQPTMRTPLPHVRRWRRWCGAAALSLPPLLGAQPDPGVHRLTERDVATVQRYLPVLVRERSAGMAAYNADVALIDEIPALRDSVHTGRLDLAAMLRRRFGPMPMPPEVILEPRCSLTGIDGVFGTTVMYLLRERLPASRMAKQGVLSALGEGPQMAVGLAERNVPVTIRFESFLQRNGYRRHTTYQGEFFLWIVRSDTVWVDVRGTSGCDIDEARRYEPAITFKVRVQELRSGVPTPTVSGSALDGMYAQDGMTESTVMEIVSAAWLALVDTKRGKPSDGIPAEFQTPEMRANFAVRESNMAWLAQLDRRLVQLIEQWSRLPH